MKQFVQLLKKILPTLVALGLFVSIQYVVAWSNPAQNPPNGSGAISVSSGNVGIGIPIPGQKLSVGGTVESTSGGFKFPDGTTQITAAASTINWNNVTSRPAGLDDGDQVGLTSVDWSIITGKPAGFADNVDDTAASVNWSSVTGKPAGFADNVDNGLVGIGQNGCFWQGGVSGGCVGPGVPVCTTNYICPGGYYEAGVRQTSGGVITGAYCCLP